MSSGVGRGGGDRRVVRGAVAVYGAFVRLFPAGFRAAYGAAMVSDFRRLAGDARGVAGVVGVALRCCLEAAWHAPVERLRARRTAARVGRSATAPSGAGGGPGRRGRRGVAGAAVAGLRELRFAVRSLARRPGFALVVVATLALGIGANVAIFAVVNAVLIRPLPYPESERIVTIRHHAPGLSLPELENSDGTIRLYREFARTVEDVALVRGSSRNLVGGERPARVRVLEVSPQFFDVVRTEPRLGRRFLDEDVAPGAPAVAILTHAGWQRHFGGDRRVLGRTVELDGVRAEIVGVMPPGFHYRDPNEMVLVPRDIGPNPQFGAFGTVSIARLAPGVTLDDARREVAALQPRLTELFPEMTPQFFEQARWSVDVMRLRDIVVGDVEAALWIVLGTVAFVLLIACANVANLFLVRAEGRKREVAIRAALGASGSRLAASVLAESVLLGVAGGVVGTALAAAGVRMLVASGAARLPRLHEVGLDGTTLLFAAAVSVLAGLAFGALPLPGLLGAGSGAALREGRAGTGTRARHRTRKLLIAGQVALALVLLTGSGLMLRSFQRLRSVDPGFRAERVLTLGISLGPVADEAAAAATYRRIVDGVAALPGVRAAGATAALPLLVGGAKGSSFSIESRPQADDALPLFTMYGAVTSGHFEAVGIPLLAGRRVERRDDEVAAPVAWVNQEFARRYLDGDAVGERIRLYADDPWLEIVGVVGDVRGFGLDAEVRPMVYLPVTTTVRGTGRELMVLTVRTAGDPLALLPAVRRVVERVAPDAPLTTARTLEQVVSESLKERSFTVVVLGLAAGVALVLGAVGLYGVIGYITSRRTREIGLRIALGARPGQVRAMVLRQGLAVIAVGLGGGLAAALALTPLLRSLLFGISPGDPLTFAAAAAVLAAVGLLATYLPARKASAVEPLEALRVD
ncbi:MAG TPA: ABC transporter permease [Longimicrobiales bacterium]